MAEQECRDKVRCAMSDKTGVLRFEGFDIVDTPECAETAAKIRKYLVGRALAEVDVRRIRDMGCDGDSLCARVVAQMVAESQAIFVHKAPVSANRFAGSPRTTRQRDRA